MVQEWTYMLNRGHAEGPAACGSKKRSWQVMGKEKWKHNGEIWAVWLWCHMRMLPHAWKTKMRLTPLRRSHGWKMGESVFQAIIPVMSCLDFSPRLLNTRHFRENVTALKCFICSVLNNLPNISCVIHLHHCFLKASPDLRGPLIPKQHGVSWDLNGFHTVLRANVSSWTSWRKSWGRDSDFKPCFAP